MYKSGLILGAVMFVIVLLAAAIVSPLCALCVPLFTGLGAGYLSGVFQKPTVSADAIRQGAISGAIAGGIAILAQVVAAVINSLVIQHPEYQIGRFFGSGPISPATVWALQFLFAFCVGAVNIGLTAAFGAGGGAIWFNIAGKTQPSNSTPSL